MSDNVFPPPGVVLSLNYRKRAKVGAIRHEIESGYDSTIERTVWPRYEWDLPFNILRQNDPTHGVDGERELLGFWLKHRVGQSFLFKDPQDFQVTQAGFAIGDGVTTTFRLQRPYGSFWAEPINNVVAGSLTVELNSGGWTTLTEGVDYSVDLTLGLVTVFTAPLLGEVLRATFEYYWRCKFLRDSQDIQRFQHNMFRARRVQIESLKVR